MIRIDRLCIWLFFIVYLLLPAANLVTFADEACTMLLLGIAFLDCVFNGNWKRYSLLWVILGIFSFYAAYSLKVVHFNSAKAVFTDFLISSKPFVSFAIVFAIAPVLTSRDKSLLKWIAVVQAVLIGIDFSFWMTGMHKYVAPIYGHVLYIGILSILNALVYLYCSIDKEGNVCKTDIGKTLLLLAVGLLSTRSKFYGEFIFFLFLLFIYQPGMFRKLSFGKVVLICLLFGIIILATWTKINFYFGSMDVTSVAQEEIGEEFARPALYVGGLMILMDYFPFGSGLASFATFASSSPYSALYQEYGLDKVYGLSPSYSSFICDAYYPSLAQFGVVGVILFLWFWVYTYKFIRRGIRLRPEKCHYLIIIGIMVIAFFMIESVGGTAIANAFGQVIWMLYGIVIAQLKKATSEVEENKTKKKRLSIRIK